MLVIRTPPLEEPLTVAGPIRVRVHGSTDARDADLTAKLVDEFPPSDDDPEGFALNLYDGICRGRFRGYPEEPDIVEPGTGAEDAVEPYPTANVFETRPRVRLDVPSSTLPRDDPNPNTGARSSGTRRPSWPRTPSTTRPTTRPTWSCRSSRRADGTGPVRSVASTPGPSSTMQYE